MVTATRKGRVVEVVDEFGDAGNVEFTTQKNSILLEHEDGTLARYKGFTKGTLKVKTGETVYPGEPLGLNTTFGKSGFAISLHIFYLSSADFASVKGRNLSNQKSLYSTVAPRFTVDGKAAIVLENRKTYNAFSSEEFITKEMSKREIKKFKSK